MSEENKALIRRWFDEVWNAQRAEVIDELFEVDGIAHGLGDDDEDLIGPAGYKPMHRKFVDAFPDIRVTVEDMVAEGDKVAARCRVQCTHDGDGLGIEATHAHVDFGGLLIARIENGKIVEAWNVFDFPRMRNQIETARAQSGG